MVCGSTVYWHSWSGGEDYTVQTGDRQDVVLYPPDTMLKVFPLGPAGPPSMSDIVVRADLLRRLGGFEEQFTGHYESRVFLSKLLLTTPVFFSSMTTNKYRQHPESCVATALRDGSHVQNRLLFLEWLERYLKTFAKVDPRVRSALRRELRPYRAPRRHYWYSVLLKIRTRLRRLAGRAARATGVRAVWRALT